MRGTHPERALEQAVEREGALHRGDRVAIACSGGADSVGLAALLSAVSKPLALTLHLAHVNHGTRESAWQDEAVVLRVSAALGIPLTIRALPAGRTSEASLRERRYEALTEIGRHVGATCVATAHTAEDQTETVLLALFRGTGAQGASGMPARRGLAEGLDLVRPLLRRTRAEVVTYVQHAGLPYAVDPTNANLGYRRNAVREALAALRPLFPGLDEAVARAASLIAEDLAETPGARLRRRVRSALREHEALEGVDFEHIAAAVRALERGRSGRFAMAPGVELAVENGELTVHREVR